MKYVNIESIDNKTGFIFNNFNGDKNYLIENLDACSFSDFVFYNNNSVPTILTKTAYLKICGDLIDSIRQKEFKKVILSRVKQENLNITPVQIFNQLNSLYKNTFNYLISIEGMGCWLGATPETLLEIEDNKFKTVSIAGTKSEKRVNWGGKELEEQQFVTDYIYNILKDEVHNLKQNGPYTINAGNIQHLKTKFTGDIKPGSWSKLVNLLHPTPATCGIPKIQAQKHINKIELHERDFYTGFLGLISKDKLVISSPFSHV